MAGWEDYGLQNGEIIDGAVPVFGYMEAIRLACTERSDAMGNYFNIPDSRMFFYPNYNTPFRIYTQYYLGKFDYEPPLVVTGLIFATLRNAYLNGKKLSSDIVGEISPGVFLSNVEEFLGEPFAGNYLTGDGSAQPNESFYFAKWVKQVWKIINACVLFDPRYQATQSRDNDGAFLQIRFYDDENNGFGRPDTWEYVEGKILVYKYTYIDGEGVWIYMYTHEFKVTPDVLDFTYIYRLPYGSLHSRGSAIDIQAKLDESKLVFKSPT